MRLMLLFGLLTCLCLQPGWAQELPYPPAAGESGQVSRVRALAAELLAAYREPAPQKFLGNVFRVQLLLGDDDAALQSIRSLRSLRGPTGGTLLLPYELYAEARRRAARSGEPFAAAFGEVFRERFTRLDNRAALQAEGSFVVNLSRAASDLEKALQQHQAKSSLSVADALELVRLHQFHQVYAAILPLLQPLLAEDSEQRYVVERDLVISTPDGARLSALLVRPKAAAGPQPALLGFTIYANDAWSLADAKQAAAHGYPAVVAYSRGKGASPDAIAPYEHDGPDAAAVIAWIARQPWCDGRVGMYGSSYNSFTQWAAAKQRPPALKALMTSASAAPGIDVPMQGNIFQNFMYPWPLYVAGNRTLDDATYNQHERWDALNRNWYRRGSAYRALDTLDGTPNPIFRRWLEHPSYDAYWQRLIPHGREFASIDIPVLATTGYFDGARVGVNYYFQEHLRHRPQADHTLLIGPYSHFVMQAGVARTVEGYTIDPVAQIDLQALRFAWFDHVLRGSPKPALLKDRINYQVMGANTWKHAATLPALANTRLRYYLQLPALSPARPRHGRPLVQQLDLRDRSDADENPPNLSITDTLDTRNALVFTSAPINEPTEISGLFSGSLDFIANKRDFDYTIALYEQMPDGKYFLLTHHLGRASYARDRSRRHLLQPGRRQHLAFRSERLVSRQLLPGSRLVVTLELNQQPGMQINYGTGKDVSDETIADAGTPLRIRWLPGSHVDLPAWR